MRFNRPSLLVVLFGAASVCLAASGNWLTKVPQSDRDRVNPLAGQADAIAAGRRLYVNHCASCHGEDAAGRGKHPSLLSTHVQKATDGEIFWLLRNGILEKGMPTWAALPEPMRWQLIAYLKSLAAASTTGAGKSSNGATR